MSDLSMEIKPSKSLPNGHKNTQTLPSKNRKNFKSVVDLGNHWVKAFIDGYDLIRFPSWYAKCLMNTSNKLPGHVRYVSGNRTELIDRCWLIGNQAVRSGSSDLIRLVEDYTGKSSLWLEYFLGTLAHLPQINPEMNIEVTATTNDVARHESGIRSNEGCHEVELAGNKSLVNIKINAVVPEGMAALKSQSLSGAVTICDIGGGNTSITRFYNSEPNGEPIVKDFGAEYLIERIANNSQLKALIEQPPNKDVINRSIERGLKKKGDKFSLFYGESNLDFIGIYKIELQDFISCRLREVIKILEKCKLGGDKILVIGGGSKLPLLGAALKAKGFQISKNGAYDNLMGLKAEVIGNG